MSRRGDLIRKRSDGRWEGRYIEYYTDEGKAKYKSVYGHSYSEARKKLLNAMGATSIPEAVPSTTFMEVSMRWIKEKETALKCSTYDKYLTIIQNHLLPVFGKKNIVQIDADEIEEYFQSVNRTLSVSSIKTIVSIIKSIFRYAQKQKITTQDISDISIPKAQEHKETNTLTNKKRMLLERYLLSDMDLCKLGVYLCLYTGLRIGELCALKWSDIDLDSGIISVRHTVQRVKNRSKEIKGKTEVVTTTPKSYSSNRDIPIPKPLCLLLEEVKMPSHFYFMSGSSEKPMEPRCLQYKFKRMLHDARIDDINFHSLRHSFASECIAVGFDVKSLSEILGHTDVEITLNRYVHSSEQRKREQMSLLFCNNGQQIQEKP